MKFEDPRYQVLRMLGQGATATVLLAQEHSSGDQVAIKVLTSAHPAFRKRVRREVEMLQAHPHPAIVPLRLADLEREPPILVFPFFSGGDLEQAIRRGVALEPARAVSLAHRLGAALAHLHRRGGLHRDVKPANVLLDEDGQAYLADLGLGRDEESETMTATGMVMGTLRYMDPEVLTGGAPQSASSDLYSLAITLTEASTGRRSHVDPDVPPFPLEVLEAIEPPSLRVALRKAQRATAASRPPDMEAFLALLDAPDPGASAAAEEATATLEELAAEPAPAPTSIPASHAEPEPPPPTFSKGGILSLLATLLLVGAFVGLRPLPREPGPIAAPPPTAPAFRGRPRLLPGGVLRLEVTRPVRAWWIDAPEVAQELERGTRELPLPASLEDPLRLAWGAPSSPRVETWRLMELLEFWASPLAGAELQTLRSQAREAPDAPEVDLMADLHEVLVGVAPRVLGGRFSGADKRRVLRWIEWCEGVLLAAGREPRRPYPPGAPGAHGLRQGAQPLGGVVLGEDDLDQGGRAPMPHTPEGDVGFGGYRLTPTFYVHQTETLVWRHDRERLLFRWPSPAAPPTGLTRLEVHTSDRDIGSRLVVHRRGDGHQPGERLFVVGGLPPAGAPSRGSSSYQVFLPDELVPAPGTELELRLEIPTLEKRSSVGVMALSAASVDPVRWVPR